MSTMSWKQGGQTMWQQGGRKETTPNPDGSTQVTITGGRYARRLDTHHAALVCGECHQLAHISRTDLLPLADSDIVEALGDMDHECLPTIAPERTTA